MTRKSTTLPTPASVGRLDRLGDVRRELAAVYRQARACRMSCQDAARLASILQILARAIADSDIERRVEALEAGEAAPRPEDRGDQREAFH